MHHVAGETRHEYRQGQLSYGQDPDLFPSLFYGLSSVLIPMAAMRDPRLLATFLAENRVTATFISPKVLRYFTPADTTLRMVVTGSERLSGIADTSFELVNSW